MALRLAHYSAVNSPLPGDIVCAVCARDSDFMFAISGKDGLWHMHSLESGKGEIRDLNLALSYHGYYRIAPCGSPKEAVQTESWMRRSWSQGPQRLQFNLEPVKHAIGKATVVDAEEKTLFNYTGFELNYVYDFVFWREHLVFATGNGLYITKPGTNGLRSILDELDLESYAVCPVGDRLFVGTNQGVYGIDAKTFDAVIGVGE